MLTLNLVKALKHRSAGVRRNALLVLPRTKEAVRAILDNDLLNDANAQVRLAACLALADMPAEEKAGLAIATLLQRPQNRNDRWIPEAAASAAAAHDLHFLKAIAVSKDALLPRLEPDGAGDHGGDGGDAVTEPEPIAWQK